MNPSVPMTTSSPDLTYVRMQVTIHHCLPERAAFGMTVMTNEQVYINSRLSRAMDLKPGDQVSAVLTENNRNTSNTPWYAIEIGDSMSRIGFGLPEIARLLTTNGVWTAEIAANFLGTPDRAGHAAALLEVAYQRGLCNKTVEFCAANHKTGRIWFAGVRVETDLLDLAELEDA